MSAIFEEAYRFTSLHEGGYHNASGANSADRGGETFKGIARKIHPTWPGWAKVDSFKSKPGFPNNALKDPTIESDVKKFYKQNFWDKLMLDQVDDKNIAIELFDTSINMGTGTAALFFQQSMNLLNRNIRGVNEYGKDISEDGGVGSETIGRYKSIKREDRKALFNLLNILQGERYTDIAKRDHSQRTFIRGWLNRVETLK